MAEHEDPPGGRAHEPGDGADQRRLAGAVRAEQPEERATRNPQLELVERARPVAVHLRQALDLERDSRAIEVCCHTVFEATLAAG